MDWWVNAVEMPKMIVFDYGHTLLYEPEFDGVRGTKAVLEYATSNKQNLSAKKVSEVSNDIFEKIGKYARENGIEIHNHIFQKLLYEYLEITIPLTTIEIERVFWENASPGAIMPNADKMINYINSRGIRSGVISNISFSGASLTERMNHLLPNNQFEFIIASSEYVFRKPNPMLFELALKKAGLLASEVWFCGDNVQADINGASAVGIYPVWYQSDLKCHYYRKEANLIPECEHLHIKNWTELIDVLEKL